MNFTFSGMGALRANEERRIPHGRERGEDAGEKARDWKKPEAPENFRRSFFDATSHMKMLLRAKAKVLPSGEK